MEMNDKQIQLLRDEKIPKVLWKLGLPTMFGLLVSALYNVVDAYFVGGLGTSQMGAVSVAFPIGQLIIGLGMTFGSGAASYLSRLLGEGDHEKANRTASTALFTSLFTGIVCIILSLCFLDQLLILLGATSTILPYARAYGMIFIGGSIFNIFNVTVNHTITSEGASRITMIAMTIGGVLNIILDPIFIYSLNLGVSGAAIATVISQAVTSFVYLWYILSKRGVLRFTIRKFAPSKETYMEILKIGIPGFIFQLLVSASMGLVNTAASVYGDAAVAAMGISIRVLTVGNYVIFGFMRGFQPIVGFNYGAKRFDRLKEAVSTALKWSTWFCVAAAVLLLVFAPTIAAAFSDDIAVIEIAAKALRANAVLFVTYGVQVVYAVLFMATGKAKEGGVLSISRQGIFFLPAIFFLPSVFGLNGVILAQPVADVFTVVLTLVLSVRLNSKLRHEEELVGKSLDAQLGIKST